MFGELVSWLLKWSHSVPGSSWIQKEHLPVALATKEDDGRVDASLKARGQRQRVSILGIFSSFVLTSVSPSLIFFSQEGWSRIS